MCESNYGGTPADWADYGSHRELAAFIASHSVDVFNVTYHAHLPRLRELLAQDPGALTARDRHGHSVLHHVDVNRERATELVRFLLENGALLDAVSKSGETALGRFLRLGADELADLMIEAGASE